MLNAPLSAASWTRMKPGVMDCGYQCHKKFDVWQEDGNQFICRLRRDIENFFAWWKRHLKVYHLIARSPQGLMVQILAGLITYLLLAIYCHEQHKEKISIKRVRELRIQMQNEFRQRVDR